MSTITSKEEVPGHVSKAGFDWSQAQREGILLAASEMIRASLEGRPITLPDPTLGGIADRSVAGAFVSLKRGKHLRSCCGFLGRRVPLVQALQESADRTAWEDVRFPPVSRVELDHLQMEVWLLAEPQQVRLDGEERLQAVTVGRHGLKVIRGDAQGLLLPGVPLDHGWDALRFLEQVCVKAGLHPSLWKDRETRLFTFEGESVPGRLADESIPYQPTWFFGAREMAAFAELCRVNIAALLEGATPNFYWFGGPDGQVQGAALILRHKASGEELALHQLSLRPGIPLQATLFSLVQGAAGEWARRGRTAEDLSSYQVGIGVFTEPALQGTVADMDPAGLDPTRRAVLVMERSRSAMVFDPMRSPSELIAEATRRARVRHPESATVFSLEAMTTEPKLVLASVPRPEQGPAIRPAAVAGNFYPADPAELDRLVEDLLGDPCAKESWPAVMVPHAGLRFSGRIAAAVLRQIHIPKTVFILGPKHTSLGVDWAIAPHQTWSLPGRTLASDPYLARQLAEAIPGLELDAQAHRQEHGIEVELPFIARLAPETKVVGIALGAGNFEDCQRFARGLAGVMRRFAERPLLVISSDMNHFATDAENRRLDALALNALETLDSAQFYETIRSNNISMCGVLPAVIVLETLRMLGFLKQTQRVGYTTSAETTGDPSRVVGYAGMLFR